MTDFELEQAVLEEAMKNILEEAEEQGIELSEDDLMELSKETLGRYLTKAADYRDFEAQDFHNDANKTSWLAAKKSPTGKRWAKRKKGMDRAISKLAFTKEETFFEAYEKEMDAILSEMSEEELTALTENDLMELSKKTLGNYITAASKDKKENEAIAQAAKDAKNKLSDTFSVGPSWSSKMKGRSKEIKDILDKGRDATSNHLYNVQGYSSRKAGKRGIGIDRAVSKLTKEENEMIGTLITKILEGNALESKDLVAEILEQKAEDQINMIGSMMLFPEEFEPDIEDVLEAIEESTEEEFGELLSELSEEELEEFADLMTESLTELNEEELSEEDLFELSKKTLGRYVADALDNKERHDKTATDLDKATNALHSASWSSGDRNVEWHADQAKNMANKAKSRSEIQSRKRAAGIKRATSKMSGDFVGFRKALIPAQEEFDYIMDSMLSEMTDEQIEALTEDDLMELSKKTLGNYIEYGSRDAQRRSDRANRMRAKNMDGNSGARDEEDVRDTYRTPYGQGTGHGGNNSKAFGQSDKLSQAYNTIRDVRNAAIDHDTKKQRKREKWVEKAKAKLGASDYTIAKVKASN